MPFLGDDLACHPFQHPLHTFDEGLDLWGRLLAAVLHLLVSELLQVVQVVVCQEGERGVRDVRDQAAHLEHRGAERLLGHEELPRELLAHLHVQLVPHRRPPHVEHLRDEEVLKELHLPQEVEDALVAHPVSEGSELGLHSVLNVHHTRGAQSEVLQVGLFPGHHDELVGLEAVSVRRLVAVKQFDLRPVPILHVILDHVVAGSDVPPLLA